ncbi:MAG: tRNA (adenosine(37)-N6)-threonylcarbamoyltransferase complex ATPase subunit type 1 TsaE [Bacteroidales bacterium]|nr:tRNA (adenosine(37)-N6)-threonylcarbamoyltransferase complex ATPase subunit type 1 TsaE [Bacteroidales bacterium]
MKNLRLVYIEEDIERTAKQFLALVGKNKHFAFYGAMGAGKTTFIKALCNVIGTEDLVSSPTFAIINEYSANSGEPIYHFDFYRIKSPTELFDIGFHEYLSDSGYCFIEWPEKANELIDDFLKVKIKEIKGGKRVLTFAV